jgi:hypothetical protein
MNLEREQTLESRIRELEQRLEKWEPVVRAAIEWCTPMPWDNPVVLTAKLKLAVKGLGVPRNTTAAVHQFVVSEEP